MALLFKLCIAGIVVSFSQAYLTGEPCRDYRDLFSVSWTRCELCSQQTCRCVYADGRLQADCEPVQAFAPRVDYGCSIGATIQNSTHIQCCPITCPPGGGGGLIEPETCETSFGGSYREGESWTKCGTGCCFHFCRCTRILGRLVESCQQACPGLALEPGCRVIEPFQNATYRDCCRTECTAVQPQCTSNTGVKYDVGQTWNECLPGDSCCQKSCSCTRRGDAVVPLCFQLCPNIAVPDGCSLAKTPLSPTNDQCCQAQCPGPDTCTSSFGVDFGEGDSWKECTPGTTCCFGLCNCVRQGGQLQKQCPQACFGGVVLEPGCRIVESVMNATHQDCCRTQC